MQASPATHSIWECARLVWPHEQDRREEATPHIGSVTSSSPQANGLLWNGSGSGSPCWLSPSFCKLDISLTCSSQRGRGGMAAEGSDGPQLAAKLDAALQLCKRCASYPHPDEQFICLEGAKDPSIDSIVGRIP